MANLVRAAITEPLQHLRVRRRTLNGVPIGADAVITVAIDPGNTQSAYCSLDGYKPFDSAKIKNPELLGALADLPYDRCVIEMVSSYGMAVGADVFETCVWIGRFTQAVYEATGVEAELIKRNPIKVHHCGTSRAKDANITQALVDRFAPGEPNHGKGTKANPGFFYGFKADIWQAMALAVYAIDTQEAAA